MKILHIYKDYHPILGGIENHIKTLAEAQAASGHEVTVLVTNPATLPSREQMQGVTVIRAGRLATVASTPLSVALPWHLRRQQPDITHLHFPYPLGEVSQLLAGRQRPFLISYHSDIVKQQSILRFYQPLLHRVLQKANHIIAGSPHYIQSSPYLHPIAAKCTAVPYAVDPIRFNGTHPLIPPADIPTILFMGRHRYYKGVDDLLRAMPGQSARLLIGGDGPERQNWEQLVEELGLNGRVQFLGNISDDDLPRVYASADIFVLPANARSEAFGKVLLEAMASGLPCITTELGTGTSFVVQHGVTGLVVPPKQPEQLAHAITQLTTNADLRRQMGQAGRDRAENEFSTERMVGRVLAIYDEILANTHS